MEKIRKILLGVSGSKGSKRGEIKAQWDFTRAQAVVAATRIL